MVDDVTDGGTPGLGRLPGVLIAMTVLTLPAGAARVRYRHELRAELCDLPHRRQRREAAGLLLHCIALRNAVSGNDAYQEEMIMMRRKPLLCYVHHKLRRFVTDEGVAYRKCVRCGEEHYDGNGDNNVAGANIGNFIAGPSPM